MRSNTPHFGGGIRSRIEFPQKSLRPSERRARRGGQRNVSRIIGRVHSLVNKRAVRKYPARTVDKVEVRRIKIRKNHLSLAAQKPGVETGPGSPGLRRPAVR